MKFTTERYKSPMTSFIQGLNSTLPPEGVQLNKIGWTARVLKQVFALALVVLIVPMTTGSLLAQSEAPPPPPQQGGMYSDQGAPPPDQGAAPMDEGAPEQGAPDQGAPQGQPLSPDQLGQMVAPIALYPDALVAQILAASTYPTQVVEADRWVQSKGNIPAEQLGAEANAQNWDPSVKALVAFPSVLAQMDKNIQWTTDLGNAYYNQPEDVMTAVQTMRSRAQAAGTLQSTPQQVVSEDDGDIAIAPANPEVVYVPTYDPWAVYGAPIVVYPGYYYGPPAGVYFGTGLAIGFGIGIGIGVFAHWGWGYHHWRPDWRGRTVFYNHNRYYTRSRTVYNRGWNRPGGPHGFAGSRGSYNRGGGFNRGGNYNRAGQGFNRGGAANRSGNYNRGGAMNRGAENNRSGQGFNRGGTTNRPANGSYNRGGQGFNRGGTANRPANGNYNRGGAQQSRPQNGNRGGSQDHAGGGYGGGGGHQGGGGHGGGGGHRR